MTYIKEIFNNKANTAIIICAVLLVICLISLIVLLSIRAKVRTAAVSDSINIAASKREYAVTAFFYKLYQSLPVINRMFQTTREKMKRLYPADALTINKRSTQVMGASMALLISISAIGIIISGGDLFFCAMGVFMGSVLFKATLEARLYRMEYELLEQFGRFVSDFPLAYRDNHGLLEDALLDAIDDLPYGIGLHITKVYDIISSPDMAEKLSEYVDYAPNKYILMFVSLCSTTREYGDKNLPDGSTAFTKGIINLEKKINTELLRRQELDTAFRGLSAIALGVVAFIKPIEWWGSSMIPEIAPFYRGVFGTTVTFLVFIASYLCYSLITSLKTNNNDTLKTTSVWHKISEFPPLVPILNRQVRQHYTKMLKINERMKLSGDHTGPKAFIVQCWILAAAAFIITNVIFGTAVVQNIQSIADNMESDFVNTIVPNDNYTRIMAEESALLVRQHIKDKEVDEDALRKQIVEDQPALYRAEYTNAVIDSFMKRRQRYAGLYYKWWYLLTAIFISIIAFHVPYWVLKFKSQSVNVGKEDEVNSFNTLMLIFMNMDGIGTENILEWLERFAFFYKDNISECIINFERDNQKALEDLLESDPAYDFKRFAKGLMKIDDVGIKESFEDLETQQDYMNSRREQYNHKMSMIKSQHAARLAFIPGIILIALYFITPLAYYSIKMITNLAGTLSI